MMRAIAISGGKGGTGKTTTAINLALALNYFEKKTIIIDCNVTTPNISLHFGTPILPVTLHDVLAEKKEISEAIYSHETGTMVIPASISYENLKNSNLSSLPKIIEELKSQADFIEVKGFMSVGFAGVIATPDLIKTILTIWGVKVLYEVIALPISMPFANWVKKIEGIDEIDKPETTSYNPFKLR